MVLDLKKFPRESLELGNDFWADIPQIEIIKRKYCLRMKAVFGVKKNYSAGGCKPN